MKRIFTSLERLQNLTTLSLMNNAPDKDLLKSVKNGSEAAFDSLYSHYAIRLKRFLSSMKLDNYAEDVIQETLTAVWRNKGRIDIDKPFDSYIFTIAKHFALKYLKKQIKVEQSILVTPEIADPKQADQELLTNELQAAVDKALAKLPERPRDVFKLRRNDGLTTEQIAKLLGISPSTVENHMNRALNAIRKNLFTTPTLFFIFLQLFF